MQQQTNEWQFSRKTRTGALVLMAILLVLIVVWRLLPSIFPPKEDPADAALQLAWNNFKKEHITTVPEDDPHQDRQYNKQYQSQYKNEDSTPQVQAHLAPFDPNTASEEELIAIGLQPRTAKTIIKYRSKGGKFRKKEDLQKLYTLSKEDYERIAPYARFGETPQDKPDYPENKSVYPENKPAYVQTPRTVELNGADAEALLALRGIGPAFSKRILNFRNALGGFVAVEQLKEVYGFPDSTYQQLKDKLIVDAGKAKKINLNVATEEELGKHPYIGRKLASNIIKYRNEIRNYSEIAQLKQVPLINDEKYRKIAPYLSTH
jgi:DNA uptake protein ComE-like DNA-binding protein